MFGLIGNFKAHTGRRDELVALMTANAKDLPGCLSYVVAHDPEDADRVWITEVWDSAESHKASLQIPAVKEAIQKALPLIAEFGTNTRTQPVGGKI